MLSSSICIMQILQLMRWEEKMVETVMHTANYIIDCHNPGSWATTVQVRYANNSLNPYLTDTSKLGLVLTLPVLLVRLLVLMPHTASI